MSMTESFARGAAGGVRALLRAEGLALLGLSLALYAQAGGSWERFALLFLAPDLSFVFFLFGSRVGAIAYNATHATIGPLLLAALSRFAPQLALLFPFALIWLAHVGFDRALGYGLKYASGFSDTHLGRIGRTRKSTT
jgi:hypothetical protein